MQSATDVCAQTVRDHDKDRYLATLFAPEDKQQALMALYAFKCEIERIPFLVSEPQIGEIRLKWWQDTLKSMEQSNSLDHPVAETLRQAVLAHQLPIASLSRLVEAHLFDLYADQMPTRNDLEGYLGETEAVLFQLGAMILDPLSGRALATASGLAGVAFGLARLLNRSTDTFKFIASGETRESLQQLAQIRLAEFRRETLSRDALPVFLPVALTETYLKSGTKPVPQWQRQWKLWRAARKEVL